MSTVADLSHPPALCISLGNPHNHHNLPFSKLLKSVSALSLQSWTHYIFPYPAWKWHHLQWFRDAPMEQGQLHNYSVAFPPLFGCWDAYKPPDPEWPTPLYTPWSHSSISSISPCIGWWWHRAWCRWYLHLQIPKIERQTEQWNPVPCVHPAQWKTMGPVQLCVRITAVLQIMVFGLPPLWALRWANMMGIPTKYKLYLYHNLLIRTSSECLLSTATSGNFTPTCLLQHRVCGIPPVQSGVIGNFFGCLHQSELPCGLCQGWHPVDYYALIWTDGEPSRWFCKRLLLKWWLQWCVGVSVRG